MKILKRSSLVLSALILVCHLGLAPASDAASSGAKCEAFKEKVAGKYALCRMKAESVFSKGGSAEKRELLRMRCDSILRTSFEKAEARYAPHCSTEGDQATVNAFLAMATDQLAAYLEDGEAIPRVCTEGAVDYCPEDDTKLGPGLCGCGMPEDDADGDEVPDCVSCAGEDVSCTSSLCMAAQTSVSGGSFPRFEVETNTDSELAALLGNAEGRGFTVGLLSAQIVDLMTPRELLLGYVTNSENSEGLVLVKDCGVDCSYYEMPFPCDGQQFPIDPISGEPPLGVVEIPEGEDACCRPTFDNASTLEAQQILHQVCENVGSRAASRERTSLARRDDEVHVIYTKGDGGRHTHLEPEIEAMDSDAKIETNADLKETKKEISAAKKGDIVIVAGHAVWNKHTDWRDRRSVGIKVDRGFFLEAPMGWDSLTHALGSKESNRVTLFILISCGSTDAFGFVLEGSTPLASKAKCIIGFTNTSTNDNNRKVANASAKSATAELLKQLRTGATLRAALAAAQTKLNKFGASGEVIRANCPAAMKDMTLQELRASP